MKTTFISKENNIVKFTMDFTGAEFDAAVVKAYQKTKEQFVVDGFRKGKAPRSIIEKRYGEGVFFEDAINDLFSENYQPATKELNLEVIDSPKADFSEIGKGKDFTVTITVSVYPVVEVDNYFGVEIEKVENVVKDEDIEKELESLQKRNARMITADRAAELGDTVLLDYSGFVGEEKFDGGTAENQELKLGSGMFIPGFEEQLVGVSKDEKKDVVVTFPEEYQAAELAGKEAVFHCLVHEVKTEELPVIDDEFAKDVSEFDTIDELKVSIKERLVKNAEMTSENAMKDSVIEKVYEANPVEVPAVLVEDEIDRMAQELDQQLRYQGLGLQQYLQFVNKDVKEFRDELRAEADKKVKTRLVLMSIVEKENVEVSNEELDEELKMIAESYKTDIDEVKKMIGEDNLEFFKKDIQLKKVIDLLFAKAVIK